MNLEPTVPHTVTLPIELYLPSNNINNLVAIIPAQATPGFNSPSNYNYTLSLINSRLMIKNTRTPKYKIWGVPNSVTRKDYAINIAININ